MVDDHPAMQAGIQSILAREAPDIVMSEATSGDEALGKIRAESWSLVLLDLSLPGRSGFEILDEIKGLRPELPILVFSMHDDEAFVIRALKRGAAGYLTKESPSQEIIKAVRRVAAGSHYLTPALSDLLIDRLKTPDDHPLHEELSSREYEIMRLLARGVSLREIGQQLFISESTVSTYRSRILKKLRLENNAQITRYTIDNGLY